MKLKLLILILAMIIVVPIAFADFNYSMFEDFNDASISTTKWPTNTGYEIHGTNVYEGNGSGRGFNGKLDALGNDNISYDGYTVISSWIYDEDCGLPSEVWFAVHNGGATFQIFNQFGNWYYTGGGNPDTDTGVSCTVGSGDVAGDYVNLKVLVDNVANKIGAVIGTPVSGYTTLINNVTIPTIGDLQRFSIASYDGFSYNWFDKIEIWNYTLHGYNMSSGVVTPINVTIIDPSNNELIGISNLSAMGGNIPVYLNWTGADNTNCTLNDTKWTMYSIVHNVTGYGEFTYKNNTGLSDGNYSLTANCSSALPGWTSGYASVNFTLNTSFSFDDCTINGFQVLNFTTYNMTNNLQINTSINYNFDYYVGIYHKNYSTSSLSTASKLFCINQDIGSSFKADITIEYGVNGGYNFNYITSATTLTIPVQNISLYITDDTTLAKFTVTDNTGTKIENVYISILKWDIATSTFKLQNQLKTDLNGEALGYITLYNTWYKFILTYGGVVYLDTEPAKVSSTTVNFVINFASDYYETGTTSLNMYSVLAFSNTSHVFTNTYANKPTTATQVCMEVQQQSLNGVIDVGTTCDTAVSGSLLISLIGDPNGTYTADSYTVIDSKNIQLRTLSVDFDTTWRQFGMMGVFVSFLLIVSVVMIGLWNIAAAILFMTIGFIVTNIMGLIHIQLMWIVTLIALAIIAIVRINKGYG